MKKKLNSYLFYLTGLALVVSICSAIWEPLCISILVLFGFYLLNNRKRIKSTLIIVDLFAIISLPILLLLQYFLCKSCTGFYQSLLFFPSLFLTMTLLIVPFSVFGNFFIKVLMVANQEKDHFDLIKSYPNLICTEHLAKTKQYSALGFKTVDCRKSKKCFARGHIKALNLVGLIGDLNNGEEYENDYYITLWDYEHNVINDGDYDIIEIQESEKIKDYDAVINRVVTFFYNELNRFKPIKEVTVRIVGNPEISESTKRLLKERFLKLEYLTV